MSVRSRAAPVMGAYQLVERLRGPALTERHRALAADGRYVVLHLVRPELARDPAFSIQFQVQAKAAQALAHPNVARIVDLGEHGGRWYLAVEEVAGEELAARLARPPATGQRFSRREVRAIVRDVASGLAHAHDHGVVHGDLRPGNVILSASGAAVLTGFVVARSLRTDDRIAVGAFAPAYMAPEQSEGKPPDQRSDIYALGVLTYELLTGRPPYLTETPLAVLLAHGREPLPLPSHVEPSIGAPLERVLLRVLAVDPAARHADALAFTAALDEAFEEDARRPATAFVPVPAEARVPRASPVAAPSRRPLVIGAAGALLLVAGAVLGAALGAALRPVVAPEPRPTAALASPLIVATPLPTAPPTPRPTVAPPQATPPVTVPVEPSLTPLPRAALLYQAKLDGSPELEDVHVFAGGPRDAAIRIARGAIELEVARPGGGAEGFFPIAAHPGLVGEFMVQVPAGSQALLTWALRRDGHASYLLRLDAATETLGLIYDDGVRLREALAPQVRTGTLRDRTVAIEFRMSGSEMIVRFNGQTVFQARDARITRAALPPDIFIGEEGGVGMFRITSARLYAAP